MNEVAAVLAAGDDLVAPPLQPLQQQQPVGVPFARLLAEGVSQVNEGLLATQVDLQRLATGETQDLHRLMIRLEQDRVAFQTLLQVRTRLLEAYQDIMRMQV